MLNRYRRSGKEEIALADFDPADTADIASKEAVAEEMKQLKERLQEEQEKLFASKTNGLLVIFQGMDCSGKDGVIKKTLAGLNPNGFRAESFKKPTNEEAAHDFLWRTHRLAPAKGFITAFNRSYYEEVLITRVHEEIDKDEAERRLKHIRNFEKHLSDSGIVVVKIFLHISADFQLRKIQERMQNPEKLWKFDPNDLEERRFWDEYQEAYEAAFAATASKRSPWHIVPANNRWFRDYLVLRILVAALEKLELSYPQVEMTSPFPGTETTGY
ncbi:PPK2 family polyphosphate kinase [Paenibacillus xanthanilyticus]|uniref:PPK2 family polyphosphate kinase n=1 Tax=Paenibacillus xanthanilyticus TaxID=1783531 RepID=A0ABV8K0S3_9BACL